MFRKEQEKRMKNYNAKTAIECLAGEPRKTKNLSMPCMPCIYAVHGNNDTPKFYTSNEKPEMTLKKKVEKNPLSNLNNAMNLDLLKLLPSIAKDLRSDNNDNNTEEDF